ncbi:MAG TPA: hypothetical protein VHA56_19560 [Mucilaginibacter sp.]|nr:hypothetical protein [Mucilaginibacter sp.]
MADITNEKAEYIIRFYSSLLTSQEASALRHHRSTIKLEGINTTPLTRTYLKVGWLSDDPAILNYLNEGYMQFLLNCAQRILADHPDKIYFNFCPTCGKLARTPFAKQCRYCKEEWH